MLMGVEYPVSLWNCLFHVNRDAFSEIHGNFFREFVVSNFYLGRGDP